MYGLVLDYDPEGTSKYNWPTTNTKKMAYDKTERKRREMIRKRSGSLYGKTGELNDLTGIFVCLITEDPIRNGYLVTLRSKNNEDLNQIIT